MRLLRILALVALCLAYTPSPAVAVTGYDSSYNSESAFVMITPGETKSFQVFFLNTGTVTWIKGSSSQVDLAACREDKVTCNAQDGSEATWNAGWLSTGRYATTTQETVGHGSVATFAYNIKAPSDATGTHRFNGDLVLSATGDRIHPEGYYQDATVEAIGNIPLPTPTPTPAPVVIPPQRTPRPTPTPLGTLTVNEGATATGCPGENFVTTFAGSGLAASTTYQLTRTRTAPPPVQTGTLAEVTTETDGTFIQGVTTDGAIAPSTYTVVVTLDGTPKTNSVTVTFVCDADLSVGKQDSPDPVVAGSNISYQIIVTNSGPDDANQVSLSDVIPANTTFVSFTAPEGWMTQTPTLGQTGTVIARRPSLTASSNLLEFTLVVNVNGNTPPTTTITNTATIRSATSDSNAENNSATTTTDVANPLLCFAGNGGECTLTSSGATIDNSAGPGAVSGVYYQVSSFTGKTLAEVTNLSFNYTGSPAGGGAPRISVPIDDDNDAALDGVTDGHAFISGEHCATPGVVSTATCTIFYSTDAPTFPGYANWAAFAAAHPTWRIAATGDGDPTVPFVVADQPGTWDVSDVHLGE